MLLVAIVLVLLLGFGEAKKQGIYLDTDKRPMCPCGSSNNGITPPRVTGGLDAGNGTFPYACYIVVGNFGTPCGATLISDRHVLTAAHCFDNIQRSSLDQVQVHIGCYDHSIRTKYLGRPRSILSYPDYNPTTLHNDIALVELDQKARGQVTAVLPAPGFSLEPGTAVSVYGWEILDNDPSNPFALQSVEMPVVGQRSCQASFREHSIKDNMLCAGGVKGQGTCLGDSGGGLAVRLGNDYVLCGVGSFGRHGCPWDKPDKATGVFTRVSSYSAWIYESTMSSGCRPCFSTATTISTSAFRRGVPP